VQLTAGLAPEGLLFALESLLGPVKFEGRCCYSTTVADQRAGLANNTTPARPRRSWGGAARDINSKSGDLAGLSGTGHKKKVQRSEKGLQGGRPTHTRILLCKYDGWFGGSTTKTWN